MAQRDDRGMLLHYPWPQKRGARSDQGEGSGLSFGTRRRQELEEIITHLAGLAWSRVGRTATRMGSARPTRLPVGSGTDRGLLRSVLGPWSPVPKCDAPRAPISVEEHTSMASRPRAKVRILRFKIFRHSGMI